MLAAAACAILFSTDARGSDLNGSGVEQHVDYCSRGPNVRLFRESFEHSLYKGWLGFPFLADQGKVAESRGDVDFKRHSDAAFRRGSRLRDGLFTPGNTGYALLANFFIDNMNTAFHQSTPDVNVSATAAADPLFPTNPPFSASGPYPRISTSAPQAVRQSRPS